MIVYSDAYVNELRTVIDTLDDIEKLFGKTVLITGGNGLVCSPVVDILHEINRTGSSNIRIVLAGRSEERIGKRFYYMNPNEDYEFIEFDSSDTGDIDCKPDYIIHGAGMGDPKNIMEDPVGIMMSNIGGLNRLLRLAEQGTERVVFVSSSEIYGKVEGVNGKYREDMLGTLDNLNPRACYPMAKRAGETLAVSYAHEYDLDVVIARPGHIYGPAITDSDSRVTAQFTRNANKGEPIVMKSSGSQIRSYCYYLDCASGILTMLLSGEKGNAYNISNPNSIVSIADMAKGFSEVSGCELVLHEASEEERKSYNLMENSSLNSDKLIALGWKPLYDRIGGITSTLKHYADR